MFNERVFGWIVAVVICLMVVSFIGYEEKPIEKSAAPGHTKIGFSGWNDAVMKTIEHDGHKFIIAGWNAQGTALAVLHHPGCHCHKARAEKEPE